MNDRFRSTLQFLLTGLLIGIVVNQIFNCFIMGGYLITTPQTSSTANIIVQKFKVPAIEIAFLLGLALNFIRITHGLIVLETSKSCLEYQNCMEKSSFRWAIPFSQIFCLSAFVIIGIYLVLFGLPNFEAKSAEVLYATMALFVVIFFWDAPTFAIYVNRDKETKKNIFALIEIVSNQAIGKQGENDCITRALVNWVVYDLACVILLFTGFACIGNINNKVCNIPFLGCLEENYLKLAWGSCLLIIISILDYWHPKLFNAKLPLNWLTNGIFYWGDDRKHDLPDNQQPDLGN